MKIKVLGSAAGGGCPQWNCGCQNCLAIRAGKPGIRARSQECVAVSSDGESWFLLNVSPEIRAQIESFSGLHPRTLRHTPIAGLVLTNGDLDHCLGLLSLRESQPLRIHATERVRAGFTEQNILYRTLERFAGHTTWVPLGAAEQPLLGTDGTPSGLVLSALPVPGKAALHLEPCTPQPEDNVGLRITDQRSGRVLAYISGVAGLSDEVRTLVEGADVVFFDGTFWSSDELIRMNAGTRRAEDMAHWPISGEHGSLAYLRSLTKARRVYIHLNNTNPMLVESSPEAAEVARAGVEIAYDGLELAP
jgi:pyrroloquinoline quinone biosynthesis protein B